MLNAQGKSLIGATLYVGLFPCNECAKAIIQAGIREVVYLSNKYDGEPNVEQSKRMLKAAGVVLRAIKPTKAQIVLNLVP